LEGEGGGEEAAPTVPHATPSPASRIRTRRTSQNTTGPKLAGRAAALFETQFDCATGVSGPFSQCSGSVDPYRVRLKFKNFKILKQCLMMNKKFLDKF
jgi:hypothetical protein